MLSTLTLTLLAGAGEAQTQLTGSILPSESSREIAAQQLKQEEHQRILGLVPEFNISNVENSASLDPAQKFQLALKSASDPFTFVTAGLEGGLSQWKHDFSEYGEGWNGYQKRFGASYADTFDSIMLGNALFPVLLHQDPRYFRKGTGDFKSRLLFAALSTIRCKDDHGNWAPNYSNVLGNLAAGGIANAYYPSSERGAQLTLERALTVSAEGAIGAVFYEFWPDISRKFFHKH